MNMSYNNKTVPVSLSMGAPTSSGSGTGLKTGTRGNQKELAYRCTGVGSAGTTGGQSRSSASEDPLAQAPGRCHRRDQKACGNRQNHAQQTNGKYLQVKLRDPLVLGTWNVRTIRMDGKVKILEREMER